MFQTEGTVCTKAWRWKGTRWVSVRETRAGKLQCSEWERILEGVAGAPPCMPQKLCQRHWSLSQERWGPTTVFQLDFWRIILASVWQTSCGSESIGAGRWVVGGRCWALGRRGWGDRKKCTNTRGFLEAKSTRLCDELEVGEEREVFKDSIPLSQVSKLRLREGNFFAQDHTASISTRISTCDCPMSKLTCFLQH